MKNELVAVRNGKVMCDAIECVVKATMTAAGNLDTGGMRDGIRVIESLGLGVNTVIAITEMIFRHHRACIVEHNQAKNEERNVYFLKSLSTGLIKIGKTTQKVKDRVSQMRGMCAGDVEILGHISEANDNTETMLHKKFKHLRINGEWFSPGEELLAYIDSVPNKWSEKVLEV